jgi:uncharacterized membrane protein (UPF0127 family)/phosphatidylserine synthase
MIILSYFGYLSYFVTAYFLALLTDILDGYYARKLKQKTKFGAKFDVLADNFVMICVLIGLYFLKREIIVEFSFRFLVLFFYYVVIQIISKILTRKVIFKRTYAANFAAIIFPIAIFGVIIYDIKLLLNLYIGLMYYSLTEKLILQIKKSKAKTIFVLNNKYKLIMLFFIIILLILLPDSKNRICFEDQYCINAEIKDTYQERVLGLMYREYLPENQGMLFVFDSPERYTFWMKNMQISIDMIFLDKNKKIVTIHKNVPPCNQEPCSTYAPGLPSLYVVEVQAGFSDKHNLEVGQTVNFRY